MVWHPLFQVFLEMLMLIKGVRSGNGFAPFVSGVSGNFNVNQGFVEWIGFYTLCLRCFLKFK